MTLRLATVLELPLAIRELNEHLFAKFKEQRTPAAETLRVERLREERERLVLAMLKQLEYLNIASLFEREYRFHPLRQWRLDLYSRAYRLGIELHGGIFSGGRHIRGSGFIGDREKMNAAAELAITVFEYWPAAIADGTAAQQIERYISVTRS